VIPIFKPRFWLKAKHNSAQSQSVAARWVLILWFKLIYHKGHKKIFCGEKSFYSPQKCGK
jgi:hypothetical protein